MDRPWRTPMNHWEDISDASEVNQSPENVDLRQEIMQRTLEEVAQEEHGNVANPCVICLELISEPAVAVPCGHANYDFLCLVSWLEKRRNCPLCKSDVSAVKYELDSPGGPKLYQLPAHPLEALPPPATSTTTSESVPCTRTRRRSRYPPRYQGQSLRSLADELARRRHVYRHKLFSLRVGSNRLSQYQELTPESFQRNEELVSRARKWIRRELQVFDFLNPAPEGTDSSRSPVARAGQARLENRRGNNAEFLLEYIIAILRTVDIKGSAGQAELLLRDFLGRDNACLFLHELQAWLRSPYVNLEDWDRNVQYDDSRDRTTASNRYSRELPTSDRTATPVYRNHGHVARGRVSKPPSSRRSQYQAGSRDASAQARRLQYARARYDPD
ncbi:hypothetical protein BDV29DRAFT_157305 [Aspergillus leporis]|uniref:RING-type E3 ubiquitin transferase n=1 Tax=Aspergillus leporis TaxID=41062 RepID=A0A5N5WYN5_9EURO|nr:hypothetical protein BDV29DRAFT_157305 [Aspergillus leporis]